MKETDFQRLSIETRIHLLREEGEYIGARNLDIHRACLYSIYGFFCELWILKSLNQVQWIEIQTNRQIIESYIKDLDIKKNFDI